MTRPNDAKEPNPATDPLDPAELQALRRSLAEAPRIGLLFVHQGGVDVRELRPGEPLVVGREAPADFAIADGSLSRRHAKFLLSTEQPRVEVTDLGSTNGLWLGDRRVEQASLAVGEEMMMGGVLVRIRLLAAPRPESPAITNTASLIAGPVMSAVLRAAERAARSRITVLLQGETGTGKEVIARHIHASSPRAAEPMISVNCGAIPKELVESTFFGHERGAFTGAHQTQRGVFENAHGGSVFLDEIGELPPSAQVALLRVLETGKITRVGGTGEKAVDVRVIAATHRDLVAMGEDGSFRQDLYFRLAAVTIDIPPLKQRLEDIPQLAQSFLKMANEVHDREIEGITPGAQKLLLSHSWPGNVRELKNVIERAVVLTEGSLIDEQDLPERLRKSKAPVEKIEADVEPSKLRARVQAYEADIIKNALAKAKGSRAEAAKLLGMPLRTLAHRIKSLEIDEDDDET